jgi:non-ribosomal peptide synthetase component F
MHGGSMTVLLKHRNTVLSQGQATNVANTFDHALSAVIQYPDRLVKEMDILSNAQWQKILEWNQYPSDIEAVNCCAHELFSKQVLKQGDAPALIGWDGNFSYRELDDITSRLGHHLVSLGVGPEILVPICFEKSVWAIVAMWAITKAVSMLWSGPIYKTDNNI